MAIFNFTQAPNGEYPELIKEIQMYVPVANVFSGKAIIGFVREAIQKQIYKAVGRDFYLYVDANTNNYPSDLIDMIKRAVFNLAFSKYTNTGGVQITNIGIMESSNATQEPARLERIANLRNDIFETGIREIDEIIAFIEDQLKITGEAAKYQKYTEAVAYAERQTLLIKSAVEFNNYYPINESRLVFNTILSEIKLVQNVTVKKLLHGVFGILESDEKAKELAEMFVKPAIAHLAISRGVMKLSSILGLNATILIFDNTANNYSKTYKTAPQDFLKAFQEDAAKKADEYLKLMISEIQENADDFPDYPHAEPIGFEDLENHKNHNHPRVVVL